MKQPSRQTISLSQLTPGMFVVELDIPWLDSPFFKHSKLIKSPKDIAALRKCGVKKLVIDTSRGAASQPRSEAHTESPQPPLEKPDAPSAVSLGQGELSVSVAQEMAAARQVRSQVQRLASDLIETLAEEKPIDAGAINPIVDGTMASLERNNQALMTLVHLSRKSQKVVDHAFSTYCLALNIGVVKGVPEQELQALGLAALLHEAGWSQLPLNLMGKRTNYTPNEARLIKNHVVIGSKITQKSQVPELVRRLIEEHHERLDGSGYPNALRHSDIHPLSQILSIADSYDERVHQLLDGPAVLPRNAVRDIYVEAGQGGFDVELAKILVSVLGIYPVTSAVQLTSGEKAVVIENCPHSVQPKLMVWYDEQGQALKQGQALDLANAASKTIERILDPNNSQDDPYSLLMSGF